MKSFVYKFQVHCPMKFLLFSHGKKRSQFQSSLIFIRRLNNIILTRQVLKFIGKHSAEEIDCN